MQTSKILSASLIDIIFDGRSKEYGAYELRKNYSRRVNRALVITMTLAALICGGAILASSSKKSGPRYRMNYVTELADIPEEKKVEEPKPEKQPETTPVKTEIYTAPIITENPETLPPTTDELDLAKIGDEKIDSGAIYDGVPGPEKIDKGKDIIAPKKEPESDDPLVFVEIDAKFNGNWVAFLERNLNADVPVDNDAPVGRYSVVIQFVVDREGAVSDITPLTKHGYGMEAEAVRVLKKAAKWEPAIQNGMKVKAYRKQVIVFVVNDEG